MKRNLIFLLILLAFLAAGVAVWGMAPRVVVVSPASDVDPLLGQQPLQITFSRSMNTKSVEERLSSQPSQSGTVSWNQSQDSMTFVPSQPWPHGETFTLRLASGAKSKLGLPLFQTSVWRFEVSRSLLAYLWPADGEANLYTLNLETGETQRLSNYPNGVLDFDVSGDGLTLYYSVWHTSEESALYALNRLSGEVTPIIECQQSLCRSPKISPDGRYLAYEWIPQVADGVPTVRLYDLENHRSLAVGESDHFTENPVWASTGALAYYDATLQTFVFMNSESEVITTFPSETGGFGTWSAAGDAFITSEIIRTDDNHAPRHLLKFGLEGGTKQDFTQKNYLEDNNPVYSPDGALIAFERKCLEASCWSPGRQLWIMSSSGKRAHVLTNASDYNHTGVVWHPDGQRLAYVRYNNAQLSEPPEIWIVNRPGAEKTRLVINGYAPRWLP